KKLLINKERNPQCWRTGGFEPRPRKLAVNQHQGVQIGILARPLKGCTLHQSSYGVFMRKISPCTRLLSQPLSGAIYLLLLTALWTGPIGAKTNSPSLPGRVLKQGGLAVRGANILLRQENGRELNFTGGEVGNFHLDNIISGNYQLIVQA